MINIQPALPSPSNLLLVPLAGPNQKSGRKGNPNWCSPYRSISQGENRVDSEGQIRQLAQLMRASVAECKMATNSSIPECVFVVGLCSSSSKQVRPVLHPWTGLSHNQCDTNKGMKNTCALGISLSCCAWNPRPVCGCAKASLLEEKRTHGRETKCQTNRMPTDEAPAKSPADQDTWQSPTKISWIDPHQKNHPSSPENHEKK